MTDRRTTLTSVIPWAGWIGGFLGWALSDQVGSDLAQADCTKAHPLLMVAIGLIGAAIAIGGGAIAFRHWWRTDHETDRPFAGNHRFLAGVSALAAGIFTLAILFQTLSTIIIPQCHA